MDFSNIHVMVVDDNEDARAVFRHILENMGVTSIIETEDGRKALNKFIAGDTCEKIDLVLCDWNMPDMEGIELLRHLRSAGSDVPFIMVTGRGGGLDSIYEARNAAVTSFVQKPCSPARLEVEIRMALQRQKAVA